MGIVYLYTFPNGKQYIGQSNYTLAQRTAGHIYEARHTPDKGCVVLNRAIIKYEYCFEREILEESEDQDELNTLEAEFIEAFNTIIPNGYNIRSGGNNTPHNPESVAKRAKSLRKKEDEKDLPMFTKKETKRGKIIWRINNHPLCSSASFDTKEKMLEELGKYERGEIPPKLAKPKKAKTTPDHIYERKNGYVIEHKGKLLGSFLNKEVPKEDLLNMARERVQRLITEGIIN